MVQQDWLCAQNVDMIMDSMLVNKHVWKELSQLVRVTIRSYDYFKILRFYTKQSYLCSILSEHLIRLLLIKIELLSMTLLHYVSYDYNTLIGMISVVNLSFDKHYNQKLPIHRTLVHP